MTKTLYERIRESVMNNVISKADSKPGDNLSKVNLSIMQFKDILYDTLMNLEVEDVKQRWRR